MPKPLVSISFINDFRVSYNNLSPKFGYNGTAVDLKSHEGLYLQTFKGKIKKLKRKNIIFLIK